MNNFSSKACDMLVASLTFVDALLRISSVTKLFPFLRLPKHVSSFAAKWHIQKLIQDVLMVGFVHNMFDTFCGYGS